MDVRRPSRALLLLGAFAAACSPSDPGTTPSAPARTIDSSDAFVRVNQVGYRTDDAKVAIAFSHRPADGSFSVDNAQTGKTVYRGKAEAVATENWGTFAHYYRLDFSAVTTPGQYRVEMGATGDRSPTFAVGPDAYGTYQDTLLAFMRQQRCGYNPFLDVVCHQRNWLLGRNPWGTSMFTGIPETGESPRDVHTSVWVLTQREAPGGLVDGPVSTAIYESLAGLTLSEPDEFAPF